MENEEYIGDAVYVSFDGYHFWLRTGDANNQRIALEPPVFDRLIAYRKRTYDRYAAKQGVATS